MKRARAAAIFATLATIAVVAAGCGGSGSGSGSSSSSSGAADLLPGGTAAYIAVNTAFDSSQWTSVQDLAKLFPDEPQWVTQIQKELGQHDNLNYQKDIKPALGPEVDIAWLDFANNGDNVVLLTQPTNEAAFNSLVTKLKAKSSPGDTFVTGTVGDYKVIADSQEVITRLTADAASDGPKLADDDSYKQAIDSVDSDSLVKAYVNGDSVMAQIQKNESPTEATVLNQIGTLSWLGAGVHADSAGMKLITTVSGQPGDTLKASGASFTPSLASLIPSDAVGYVGFQGSDNMFNGLKNLPQLSGTPASAIIQQWLHDAGGLLDGENAVYVRPDPAGGKTPEIAIIATPSSSDGANTLNGILSLVAAGTGGSGSTATTIDGIAAHSVTIEGIHFVFANVGDHLVVSNLPSAIGAVANPSATLADNDAYKAAVSGAGVSGPVHEIVYASVPGALALGESLSGQAIPPKVKTNLAPLKGAIENWTSKNGEAQLTFYVSISQ